MDFGKTMVYSGICDSFVVVLIGVYLSGTVAVWRPGGLPLLIPIISMCLFFSELQYKWAPF